MVHDSTDPNERTRLVAVGRVAKTHGRNGEVAVDPLTDFPDRFFDLSRVFVKRAGDESPVACQIETARMHKGRPLVKLSGVSSIDDAEALRGREFLIPESELLPLPEDSFYHFQLEGLLVVDRTAGAVGVAERVLETGGTDVLVVRSADGEETLVPLCRDIVKNVDQEKGRIDIEAPEGLVSLNAN
jgi:16S rRNA processing protein RimM